MRGFSVLLQKVTPLKLGCSPSASLTCYVIYGMCTVSSFCVFLKYSYFHKYFLLYLPCHLSCQILVPWPGIKPWPPEAWSQQEYWEWGAISSSRGSSPRRDQTQVSCIVERFFTIWAIRAALENSLADDQKIKNRIMIIIQKSNLGYISKRSKSRVLKSYFIPSFIAALLTIAKTWKQFKCSWTQEWISKM